MQKGRSPGTVQTSAWPGQWALPLQTKGVQSPRGPAPAAGRTAQAGSRPTGDTLPCLLLPCHSSTANNQAGSVCPRATPGKARSQPVIRRGTRESRALQDAAIQKKVPLVNWLQMEAGSDSSPSRPLGNHRKHPSQRTLVILPWLCAEMTRRPGWLSVLAPPGTVRAGEEGGLPGHEQSPSPDQPWKHGGRQFPRAHLLAAQLKSPSLCLAVPQNPF